MVKPDYCHPFKDRSSENAIQHGQLYVLKPDMQGC